MQRQIFSAISLLLFVVIAAAGQQIAATTSKPSLWSIETIKVKPGMFGLTLGHLDDDWMRVREEAKRDGAIVTYYRIAEKESEGNGQKIVLLTQYKDEATYESREQLFASIRKKLPKNTAAVMRPEQKDLYETVDAQVFQDYSEAGNTRFRLLAKH